MCIAHIHSSVDGHTSGKKQVNHTHVTLAQRGAIKKEAFVQILCVSF